MPNEPGTGQHQPVQPVPYQQMQPMQPMQYPPMPPGPHPLGRPGAATAASVLGFVQAGLAIVGGLVVMFAFSVVDAEDRASDAGAVFVAALFQFVVCGFLIYSSVNLLRGRAWQIFQACLTCMLALCVFYFSIFIERVNEVPDGAIAAK